MPALTEHVLEKCPAHAHGCERYRWERGNTTGKDLTVSRAGGVGFGFCILYSPSTASSPVSTSSGLMASMQRGARHSFLPQGEQGRPFDITRPR